MRPNLHTTKTPLLSSKNLRAIFFTVGLLTACKAEDPTPVIESLKAEFKSYGLEPWKRAEEAERLKLQAEEDEEFWKRQGGISMAADDLPETASVANQLVSSHPNQGHAGACKTFSSVASIESAYFRRHGKTIKLSELWPLRMAIAESLLQNQPNNVSPAIYLGMSSDDILWWTRRTGWCSAASLPYSSGPVERYDILNRQTKEDQARLAEDFIYFRDELKLREDSNFSKCDNERTQTQEDLTGLEEIRIWNADAAGIRRWLAYGIPVSYTVRGSGSPDELNPSSAHQVVLVGYDAKVQRFILRNSWGFDGQANQPNFIRFGRVDRDSQDENSFAFAPTAVVSREEIAAACTDPRAPAELQSRCKRSAQ